MAEGRKHLSSADIRARLAGTTIPRDPTRVELPPELEEWPPHLRERLTAGLKPAGVLIPIIDHGRTSSVLLTRRSAALKYHAGQVSFPGGRMERGDRDIEHTALREAHEEVGLEPHAVDIAGYLAPTPTITGYAVTPVVGLLQPGLDLRLDPGEVEHAFEVPLGFLLDVANQRAGVREYQGLQVPIVEFVFGSERIWGATANILLRLRAILIETP
jgi:8-oxo-dGTP pyrophosphatase MutT (NUDIX family)